VRACPGCPFAKLEHETRTAKGDPKRYFYYCYVTNQALTGTCAASHIARAELEVSRRECTVNMDDLQRRRSELIGNRRWCERKAKEAREALRSVGSEIRQLDEALHEIKALEQEMAARTNAAKGAAQAAG
jgi:hypothetical protein